MVDNIILLIGIRCSLCLLSVLAPLLDSFKTGIGQEEAVCQELILCCIAIFKTLVSFIVHVIHDNNYQTLSKQLHPPQRHQRLQTTPQYYWTSQLPLPHLFGYQIPLHLFCCDMKKYLSATILHYQDKPHLLPKNISASTVQSLMSHGSLPYMDILIRNCLQKTYTHTNLYVRYNSFAPSSSKDKNGHPPDRVKRIIDSVKPKLENKLNLKQFNIQLKSTTPSLTASFPFQPTITKKIKKFLESHNKLIRDYLTGPTHQNEDYTYPHLTPDVINEISCYECTTTKQWADEPTLNQKDQRTRTPLKTSLTQP